MKLIAISGWVYARVMEIRAAHPRRHELKINSTHAEEMMRAVAPGEDQIGRVIDSVTRDGSIMMFSPDGAGGLRHDQPGTITHTPPILFVSETCRVPLSISNNRTLIVRVIP